MMINVLGKVDLLGSVFTLFVLSLLSYYGNKILHALYCKGIKTAF